MARLSPRLGRFAYWLVWPGLWLVLYNTRRTRVIISSGDEILLVKTWLGDGRWGLPGGGLHRGEEAAAGAAREITEETGMVIAAADLMLCEQQACRTQGFRYTAIFYKIELPSKPPLQLRGLEISQVAWLARGQLATVAVSPDVTQALSLLA